MFFAEKSSSLVLLALVAACSSSSSAPPGGSGGTGGLGGPIAGTADTHCKGKAATVVDPTQCKGMGAGGAAGAAGGGGAGSGDGAGAAGASSAGAAGANGPIGDCPNVDPAYGDIAYGVEADDDDCKYHVKWSITPFARGQTATFTVSATHLSDGSPVIGAAPRAELFLPCELTHPPPALDFDAKTTETAPGTYTIGPVAFDAEGHWAVRFHFDEQCDDAPASPHGHAAFYLGAP